MELSEKLALLEDILDVDAGSLSVEQELADLDEWDSLSALSVVVMVKDEFNKKLTGSEVRAFVTIQDIIDVMN